jgi:transposase InsO family protein
MTGQILFVSNRLLISKEFLNAHGTNQKAIDNWLRRRIFTPVKIDKVYYVSYDCIPAPTRAKLPSESELLALYHSQQKAGITDSIYKKLKFAQSARCNYYQNIYRNEYKVDINKSLRMAMKAGVWERLLELHKEYSTGSKGGIQKGMLDALLKAYLKLYPNSYVEASFSRAINFAKEKGVIAFCYDGRIASNRQQHNKKYDDRHMALLFSFFSPGKGYKGPYILKQMQHACAKLNISCPKITWVKENMQYLEFNPSVYAKRYGKMEAEKMLPNVSLLPADYAGDQYQLDGWVMPFLYQDKGSKGEIRYRRPVFNAVFDNHSKKIVGYCITHTENREAVLEALEDAVKNTGGLPVELVSDNHSFNQTKEIANFKDILADYAVTWTVTSNPRQKLTAESSFKYITEQITKSMPGNLGLSITSKSKAARPSQEEIDKYLKASHRLSFEEIRAMGVLIAETWNNQNAPGRNNTPNKLFASSPKPHLREIDELDRLRIFTKKTEYRVIKCQIVINIGGRKEYLLPIAHEDYYGRNVVVRYASLDEIYIFDAKNDRFICTLKQKRKAHGAIANQTAEDFEIMNQQTALRKAVVKRGQQRIDDMMRSAEDMQPGIINLLNVMNTPKSVLEHAQENEDFAMALRANNLDPNRMLINKKTSDLNYKLPETKEARKAKSPYRKPGHVFGIIENED